MPARDELLRFIEAARISGASEESLIGVLKASGWSERVIYDVFREHYERTTGIPVPVRRGLAEGSRDAFVYLLSFATLTTWTIALGSLLFALIEHTWRDRVIQPYLYYPGARDLASLIVAFPVYMLVMRMTVRDLSQFAERREAPVRRWLTYLALFIAAGVVMGDFITVLSYLLQGEITTRFLAKATTVFALAGGVFGYYFSDLRGENYNVHFASAAFAAVAAGLLAGFSLLGSPTHQRQFEADRRRMEHLQAIAYELSARPALPVSVSELSTIRADPDTASPYEYRKLDESRYQLCAVFSLSDQEDDRRTRPFWRHNAGRKCYLLDKTKPVP